MKNLRSALLVMSLLAASPAEYTDDFEQSQVGKVPDDLMVLDGSFAVRSIHGNKCLELAADPIGTFGVLFGPATSATVDVQASVWSTATGKRFPEFGIGSGDAGGWKLWLVPAQHSVELRKNDEAKSASRFDWKSGTWTKLRLRVRKSAEKTWTIEGKAWPQDAKEPDKWLLSAQDSEPPPAGRGSIWGAPLSEQPIRFDDLSLRAVP